MAKKIGLAVLSLVVLGMIAVIAYSWVTFQDWQKQPGGFWLLTAAAVGGAWYVLTHLKDVVDGFKALLQLPHLLAGRAEPRRYRQGQKPKAGKAPASVPAANEVLPKGSKGPDFRYNPNFVGRQADLIELGRLLVNEDKPQPVVISGTGGAGKTQLAVEFCYHYGRFFEGVHWIQANRPEDIESGIAACGMAMDFEPWPDKLAEQVQVTLNAWQAAPKRLVVLDNLEESEALRTWLARLGGVRVLVTARRESWPTALDVQLHPLPLLARDDSLKLLRTQAERLYQVTDERLEPIAERLGNLPLALELAGRYLACRERLTPEGYLVELAQVGGAVGHISQREAGKNSATGHSGSLADTFMLSWQALNRIASEDILQSNVTKMGQLTFKMAGWCAPGNPIPLEVLRYGVSIDPDEIEEAANSDAEFEEIMVEEAAFELGIQRLYHLGLLVKTPAGPVIHPLLADFAQTLQTGGKVEGGTPLEKERGLEKLCLSLALISSKATDTRLPATFLPLHIHIETVAHFAGVCDMVQADALWNNLGIYLQETAEFQRARTCFERALAIDEKVYGSEDPRVAIRVNNLGLVLRDLGELDKAKACYKRALAINEKEYGSEHSEMAKNINNMGQVLQELDELHEAKACFERALAIDEKVFGPGHSNVARDINNLAMLLQSMGDLNKAKAYCKRALVIDEKVYGPEHPEVATDVNNLGCILRNQGELEEAKACFERALVIDEKVYGPEHPKVATTLNNLGSVLQGIDELDEAKACFERALAIYEKVYGLEHANVAIAINSLGVMLQDQGELDEAKACFERALVIDEKVYGSEHTNVAIDVSNLAYVLYALDDLEGAKERFERALRIFTKVLPADHPNIRMARRNLEGVNAQLAAQKKD